MTVAMLDSAALTFGRQLRAREAGDFLVRLARYPAARSLAPHRHPRPYFCYVVRGGLDERCAGPAHHFSAGSVHFHPAGESHSARTSPEGLESLSVVPLGARIERAAGIRRIEDPRPAAQLARHAARCHDALLAEGEGAGLILETAALELLAAAMRDDLRAESRAPRWIGAVREYLHAHYAERIALRELAALASVHEVHVVRGFRRHVGTTPGAYQRRLRLDAARRSLLETSSPIVEIALAAGFAHQSHFTRAFRLHTGHAPAAFRRLHARAR